MLTGTFSIVALDRATGEIGVAVASRVLAVGAIVPWARAGVGAVATQAWTDMTHGPEGLRLLADGLTAADVVKGLVGPDGHRERRQVGVVDAHGRSAAWTGGKCTPWAGHRSGDGYTCQGNMLVGTAVVDAMAQAYEDTGGPLPERLLAALQAGQDQGGDRRGQQSAGLLVVLDKAGFGGVLDRYVDLRVDDAGAPIAELRRLLATYRRQRPGQAVIDEFVLAAHGDLAKVRSLLDRHPVLVQGRARWDESPLEAAAHTGQREVAELLLSAGAPLDICTAAMLGMKDRVAALLQADPGLAHAAGAHGIPVLFYPVISGQREVADLLAAGGADPEAGEGGNTPLHGAAIFGQTEMAAWLLAKGANPNARDRRGRTPLQLASEGGHADVVQLLQRHGAQE